MSQMLTKWSNLHAQWSVSEMYWFGFGMYKLYLRWDWNILYIVCSWVLSRLCRSTLSQMFRCDMGLWALHLQREQCQSIMRFMKYASSSNMSPGHAPIPQAASAHISSTTLRSVSLVTPLSTFLTIPQPKSVNAKQDSHWIHKQRYAEKFVEMAPNF